MRGNVMDLAVGVVIGSAFNKIITAVVDAVFMPIIAMLTGDINKFDEKMVGRYVAAIAFRRKAASKDSEWHALGFATPWNGSKCDETVEDQDEIEENQIQTLNYAMFRPL